MSLETPDNHARPEPAKTLRRAVPRGRDGWFLPGALAAAVALLMVLTAGEVRVPGRGSAAGTQAGEVPELKVVRLEWMPAGGQVRESLRLLDPTPLFMPADRFAEVSVTSGEMVDRPGGGVTENFAPALTFSDTRPAKGILRPEIPGTPLAAAEFSASSRWFDGLSRIDRVGEPGAISSAAIRSGGRMDVYRRGEAASFSSVELPVDSMGPADWRPLELSVLVNAAGAVSAPLVISGSGEGELDERIRSLVKDALLPRLRLRPGAYRLVVGP